MKASGIGILTGVVVSALLLTIAAVAVFGTEQTVTERRVLKVSEVGQQIKNEPAVSAEASEYVLRSYGVGLGLFRAGEEMPFACVEAELSCLPECDRAALAAGIYVSSEAELRALAEDFSS
ncbi:MAG: hypothetical protein E7501_02040 [Ruminococcus sp.]|nr:hypothetical protein [Ruminococcus sp.]